MLKKHWLKLCKQMARKRKWNKPVESKIAKINQALLTYYEKHQISENLQTAILYSIESGGKRIRPLLFLAILSGFQIELNQAHFDVAAAVEMIHTGSLIHDDLPAMDNDDYRRGQLTSHKKFNEATAILAGDSLFLDPFGLLARANLTKDVVLQLIVELSDASGSRGMVAGQLLDMSSEDKELTLLELQKIHANKTGKLLAFPFVAAGLVAEVDENVLSQLRQAGELIGFAFQIRDDILDVTADFAELGKTPNKDVLAEKSTYPRLLGLEESYQVLDQTLAQTEQIFHDLGSQTGFDNKEILSMVERLRLHG